MKFKVTPKDMAIFCAFAVFLLYFCAIATLNVLTLINEGEFYGFNPIEAFTPKYIFVTLLLFFIVLIAIFLSVSSTIFEHEKGFGFGLSFGEKEEKGYSRWLKEKEMKKGFKIYKVGVKDLEAPAGGIVIINDGKNMWVDDSEFHTLVIGVTGSGKTTAVVDPLIYSLCKHGESMIFTDPKGEIYKIHAELLKARGYNIIVLNFRSPSNGNAWNPLTLPYRLHKAGNIDKSVELVDDVALNILQDKKASDPFWEKSASDYFSGCALGLIEDAKEEQVNLNSISYMTTVGEEKFGAGSNYIKEYFNLKGESSSAYVFASNTINSPTETKGGILSVFRQKIRLFASREQLSEMLSYSDFDMRDIGKEKTAVFMIIHDEKTTYHALATIFIKQCYETLIDVAQENGGKLPYRTNFILDEFANMPPLKDVTTMVTAARSRAIRFTFIIQNFAQLNDVYGKEDAETIRSNCGNLIYLLTTELAALEEISKLCGEVKSKKDDKTASQPLITVSDLQKLQMNEVIILRNRMHPFRTKLKQGFDTDWGDREFGKAEFFEREKKDVQLFDVIDFVKVRKKSKMMEDMNNPKKDSPFAGLAGNPFNTVNPGEPPRIPTFEEFLAARNRQKENDNAFSAESLSSAVPKEDAANKKNVKPELPTFNVDDLVKKIDAKIAEIEAKNNAEGQTVGNTPKIEKQEVSNQQNALNVDSNAGIGFNPFNKPSTPNKFIDSDLITSEGEQIQTGPLNAPVIDSKNPEILPVNNGEIETFEDLIHQKNPEMPANKPSVMISNPIDTETKVPELPSEPIINNPVFERPLTGITDPTKTNLFTNNQPEVKEEVKPEIIPANNQDNNVSDDAFFDAFFDED